MIVTAVRIQEGKEDLYQKFILSRSYLDTVCAVRNKKSLQQSLAGMRALLLLLESEGIDPRTLELRRSKGGKPYIEGGLEFNISHSGELAVCVLSDKPVGIDIEKVRFIKDPSGLAERFFGEDEKRALCQADDKTLRFFEIWTKKEAYLKQKGSGIDTQLNLADVWESPIALRYIDDKDDKYVIAVAGEGELKVVGGCQWQIQNKRK